MKYGAGGPYTKHDEGEKVLRRFKKTLRLLKIIKGHPMADLMDALEAGSAIGKQNFGAPDQLFVSQSLYNTLKKVSSEDDNLKP